MPRAADLNAVSLSVRSLRLMVASADAAGPEPLPGVPANEALR
jgi:hypothetical protein